ncbi:MAG: hypothetical protein HYV01_10470 [Deltaproteobacteria bacterium]|nr:hypothetical protein [Deltaproteobacteria bacterium]
MVFQPDELASHEYQKTFKRTIPFEPEKRLLLAVLEDAIICFQKYFDAFENICDTCGLDADYLRTGLLNWRNRRNFVGWSNKSGSQSRRITTRHWSMRGQKR